MDQKNLYVLGEATEKTGLGEAINKTGQIRSIILIWFMDCFAAFPEKYSKPSRKSTTELFCEIVNNPLDVTNFRKRAPSQMFDRVLITSRSKSTLFFDIFYRFNKKSLVRILSFKFKQTRYAQGISILVGTFKGT